MKKSIFLIFATLLCAVSMQAKKIYLFPSSDWQSSSAKFGLHTWNASNDSDNKSQLMTKINGVTPVVYEADIPDSHNKVIFLRMNSNTSSFDWNKEWNRSEQSIPSDGKNCFFIKNWTESVKWDTYTYTVVGASTMLGSNWNTEDTSNDMVKIDDDNWALVKRNVSLKKNTNYEYKLVMAHSWDYWSTPSSNAKLTVPADGTYDIMFNYNYKTNKLTCTAVLPQTIYCINTQEWNTVSIHNWLTDKITTTWPGDAMTKTGDKWAGYNIYKKEISGLHKYSIFNNNSGKQTDDLTIGGTYYDLGSGKWYNELPTPKFCLKGVFNSWSEDNTFTATTDPNLLTTTIALSEGTHNFKVAICDLWLGNSGTMERHGESVHEGGWEFKNKKDDGNDADECKIKADIAGEYIFTWNISQKKLTVTYPKYTISTVASPTEGGTVSEGGDYDPNATITLTATANEGYKFVNWTKGGEIVSTDATYTFTAREDAELVANFKATTITLTTGNNDAVIAANIGNTVDVVIERSFTANDGYYTLCVPFNMPASVIGKAYSLGTITEHVAGEGININLKEEYELSAGMPYLVLPKANMSELVVENVTILEDGVAGQGVSNDELNVQIFFQGYYSAPGVTTNGTTEYYVGNNGHLYNGEVEIRGLSGLFTITDTEGNPAKVRARVVTREDAATGLDNITNGENTTIKLIENGQLIIIRNGEKFNAQGVRL